MRLAALPRDTWSGKPGKPPSKSLAPAAPWQMWHKESLGCAGAPAPHGSAASGRREAGGGGSIQPSAAKAEARFI